MSALSISCTLLSALDDIAWTFNLRGSDIDYNPLFFSWALIFHDRIVLFVQKSQEKKAKILAQDDSYSEIEFEEYDMAAVPEHLRGSAKIWADSNICAFHAEKIGADRLFITSVSEPNMMKMTKTSSEMASMKKANVKAALALAKFFAHVETKCPLDGSVTEFDLVKQVEDLYAQQADYKGQSFMTISASKGNAASPHYKPTKDMHSPVLPGIYLCDSGATYVDGTTAQCAQGAQNQDSRILAFFTEKCTIFAFFETNRIPS